MSEEQTMETLLPTNTDITPPNLIDSTVKVKANLSPGVAAPPMLPPSMAEYMSRVASPFYLHHVNWMTSHNNSTVLATIDVSPTVKFWHLDYVPYFVHEAFKWAYYRGSFKLRIVFFGSSAYRGSIRIQRTFATEPLAVANSNNNVHYHSIDGGNLVHEHQLRFSSRAGVKFTMPITHPRTTSFAFQDLFYERLQLTVISPLNAPSIYPTTVPILIFLEPQEDIQFLSRRNNLSILLPTITRDDVTPKREEVISLSNVQKWINKPQA